jgi:hypothetical protein
MNEQIIQYKLMHKTRIKIHDKSLDFNITSCAALEL